MLQDYGLGFIEVNEAVKLLWHDMEIAGGPIKDLRRMKRYPHWGAIIRNTQGYHKLGEETPIC